ncbi:MAG TPA: hypothetical protein VKU01_36535 [Bryobacteraceae bacterium]|nr:hypothetical protein [Bryobacteraceae bacterium]
MTPRRRSLLDSFILLALGFALIQPLFNLEYLNNWASIESTFIAQGRMLREHLPHTSWQPLWYCGTRFDYIYPPALPYGTALLSLATGRSTARAYHLYTASLYVLGIVGVYWLAFAGSRSRLQAWIASLGVALFSPSLVLMKALHNDSPDWVPQRLHVLMSYGEGPHISALAILGFALAACFVALREWRPPTFVLAGFLCAAVVSNNFYGATALAICFPLMAWAIWLDVRGRDVWLRAAGIAVVAYGLCAFWLTPSYIRITTLNLRWVAEPRSSWSLPFVLVCLGAFGYLSFRFAKDRRNVAWPVFLAGSVAFFAIYVLSSYYLHFVITGNAMRLAPELDLAILLLLAYAATTLRWPIRAIAAIVLIAACYPAIHYVRHAWSVFPRISWQAVQQRCEYRVTKWVHENLPNSRAMPPGSIRFWYDTWFDNSQMYGGSDQGLLNQILPGAAWVSLHMDKPDVIIALLDALGVDAYIVADKTSEEVYHDVSFPDKFRGAMPVLFDDHQGNVVYRVPRSAPGIARIVDPVLLSSMAIPHADDLDTLRRYDAAIENGGAKVVQPSPEVFDITANISAGQALLLQESFDPAWHAYAGGKPLAIRRDPLDFMLVDVPQGAQTIHFQFETPLENWFGWILTVLTCAACLGLLFLRARTATDHIRAGR